jgi:hypothetical protein
MVGAGLGVAILPIHQAPSPQTSPPILAIAGRGAGRPLAAPAATSGLAEIGARVRFRHPLVRSAAYRSAPDRDRREVYQALRKPPTR